MSRPLSFLQELRVVREINASLPFADPIALDQNVDADVYEVG